MKNVLFALLALILLTSCTKEGALSLNFKGVFQDEPLRLNTAYDLGDLPLKFENLAFYLTDISLVDQDGKEVSLSEVEFIQLNDNPEEGHTVNYQNLPGGTYEKLKFNIGVSDDLNAKTPNDYSVEEPLGRSDHYWEAWESYIFSKTEGSADPDGDGVFDLKWFYHTGSDALNRAFELQMDIIVDGDGSNTIEFVLDYDLLLRNADGTPFDIEENPRNHDPSQMDIVTQLVDNYVEALKVKS